MTPYAMLSYNCERYWCLQARSEGFASFVEAYAQVVDNMAALLSASVLQLLGGCHAATMAWEALQASLDCCCR